ncbi:MAG: hypothetical protein IPN33_20970 [Saprospiraceae bacterium]|nr:hypothetical protein [Saprospiraceae bacterium]
MRRKAFYPYHKASHRIDIAIKLQTKDISTLEPQNIELSFTSPGFEEQLETWLDVFSIENRYKAIICGKNDGLYWYAQIVDEIMGFNNHHNKKEKIRDHLTKNRRLTKKFPWADKNFLKTPFLENCEKAGLFYDTHSRSFLQWDYYKRKIFIFISIIIHTMINMFSQRK